MVKIASHSLQRSEIRRGKVLITARKLSCGIGIVFAHICLIHTGGGGPTMPYHNAMGRSGIHQFPPP